MGSYDSEPKREDNTKRVVILVQKRLLATAFYSNRVVLSGDNHSDARVIRVVFIVNVFVVDNDSFTLEDLSDYMFLNKCLWVP